MDSSLEELFIKGTINDFSFFVSNGKNENSLSLCLYAFCHFNSSPKLVPTFHADIFCFFKFGFICYNNEFSYPILFPLKWYKSILSGFKFGLLFKFFNHMHLD